MRFGDSLKIPYVILVGEEERTTETFTLKNMQTGQQTKLSLDELIHTFALQH